LCFLHAILAEIALPCVQQRPDRFDGMRFGYRDERDVFGPAAGKRCSARNISADRLAASEAIIDKHARPIEAGVPLRQPAPDRIPRQWLMTDERLGEDLWRAIARLPHGAGIVFRHHDTPLAERRALFARLQRIADEKSLLLVRAGAAQLAEKEAGIHGRVPRSNRHAFLTWPAHDRAELLAGVRAGANLLFVSPIFATRSHPDAGALGPARATAMVRNVATPAIALGGMDETRFALLEQQGFYGWAGIDAWLTPSQKRQKRNAVPI
jgi:thiamine-phosphate pyrophosphorylase